MGAQIEPRDGSTNSSDHTRGGNRGRVPITRDRLRFDQPSEVDVYEALKRVQASRDPFDTIGIAPRVPFRVRDNTFRLDLLVTYRGRVGVIEVDGASHHGKWSNDRSRDYLLGDSGVPEVYRIDVEDTRSPSDLDAHIRRFLKRLTR